MRIPDDRARRRVQPSLPALPAQALRHAAGMEADPQAPGRGRPFADNPGTALRRRTHHAGPRRCRRLHRRGRHRDRPGALLPRDFRGHYAPRLDDGVCLPYPAQGQQCGRGDLRTPRPPSADRCRTGTADPRAAARLAPLRNPDVLRPALAQERDAPAASSVQAEAGEARHDAGARRRARAGRRAADWSRLRPCRASCQGIALR